MMAQSGFPRSLWSEAMRNAEYMKNRVYNMGTQAIPYEKMYGVIPNIHHIRTFGSLAYVHVPVTPGRHKHHENAKLGFVLGYAEDVVGCKVYFPEKRVAKFVADLRVAEDEMHCDRHGASVDDGDLESLHLKPASEASASSRSGNSGEMATFVNHESDSGIDETMDLGTVDIVGDKNMVDADELLGGDLAGGVSLAGHDVVPEATHESLHGWSRGSVEPEEVTLDDQSAAVSAVDSAIAVVLKALGADDAESEMDT
ncbi:hypothetical protein PC112_g8195 [Phytophthora cactorum]|nr:hypothetical protein PC112_g8195 [Phytophthora cactorum]